jgi:hypothetical protein
MPTTPPPQRTSPAEGVHRPADVLFPHSGARDGDLAPPHQPQDRKVETKTVYACTTGKSPARLAQLVQDTGLSRPSPYESVATSPRSSAPC